MQQLTFVFTCDRRGDNRLRLPAFKRCIHNVKPLSQHSRARRNSFCHSSSLRLVRMRLRPKTLNSSLISRFTHLFHCIAINFHGFHHFSLVFRIRDGKSRKTFVVSSPEPRKTRNRVPKKIFCAEVHFGVPPNDGIPSSLSP